MKLIFLNRFAYPDYSATSQILCDLAFDLANCEGKVHIVTSRQTYENPHANLPAEEVANGVNFHRVSSTAFGRTGLVGRLLDYLSFYFSMHQAIRRLAQPGDILIAMTDPPLISIMATAFASHAYVVTWLQDIYPEIAIALRVPLMRGLGQPIRWLRDRSLRASAMTVLVGEGMRKALLRRKIPAAVLRTIPNWTDDEDIVPLAPGDNPLRREWGLTDKFVVGYSGNLGRAHEYRTVLEAAARCREHPQLVFLFIGGGHGLSELQREVSARQLEHAFRFMPYQPRDMLKYSMSVPDVHWISLKPELEGYIVPSKFYSAAAAGRPIVAIGAVDGELGQLIQQHGCGAVYSTGDAERLSKFLLGLRANPHLGRVMGERARVMLETKFSRTQALQRWRELIQEIKNKAESAPAGAVRPMSAGGATSISS